MPNAPPTHKPIGLRSEDRPRMEYGAKWRRLRRMVLRRQPMCQHPGCSELATEADHILAVANGGDNSFENLQGLCKSHHSRKTALEDGGFGHG